MSLPTRLYLFTYNFASFALWATCTLNAVHLVAVQHAPLPILFDEIYHPLLTVTQTFAVLEILHSLVGLVRAPLVTTAMQVASRLLLVWGVMYPFGMLGLGGDVIVGTGGGSGTAGALSANLGDYAFAGCLGAWGVTECIRYGFFALQVSGIGVPGFWSWLRYVFLSPFPCCKFCAKFGRYNTFYILYPLGISSECALVVKALTPAAELNPLFHWFFIIVLGIYVPGRYSVHTI